MQTTDKPGFSFPKRDVLTVSRLNTEVKMLLEGSFPLLWVEGEISNLARPASGHIYLSLKDAHAQVSCAMFRNRNMNLRFQPANGQKVLVRARVSLFEARGNYQMILEHMEPAGDGALQRAFEELKARLEKEGLFDPAGKQTLPRFPARIGLITSDSGAAVRDVLTVLKRRFPAIPVRVYPVPVQGEKAATEIARMLDIASEQAECDVLILTRGGGSLEDLQAFNTEIVARSIAACEIPVISAVGHEIDFTIADFVADLRAPTPSAAAETAVPDQLELVQTLQHLNDKLTRLHQQRQQRSEQQLNQLQHRLQQVHPQRQIQSQSQLLDELEAQLHTLGQRKITSEQTRLEQLSQRLIAQRPERRISEQRNRLQDWQDRLIKAQQTLLTAHSSQRNSLALRLRQQHPGKQISAHQQQLEQLRDRLQQAATRPLEQAKTTLGSLAARLDTVSPLNTLKRGYSITRTPKGQVITHVNDTQPGAELEVMVQDGELLCEVKAIQSGKTI